MNGRLSRNRFALASVLFLCCFLAQAQGALGLCAFGWHVEGCGPGYCIFGNSTTGTSGSYGCTLTFQSLVDPIRGCLGAFPPWQGGIQSSGFSQTLGPGQCTAIDMTGNKLTQDANGNFHANGWPAFGAIPNCGYYLATATVSGPSQSENHVYNFTFFSIGGSLFNGNCPPGPPADPSPPPNIPVSNQTGTASLTLKCLLSDGTTGAQYLPTYVYGPTVQAQRLDTNGVTTYTGLAAGSYAIHMMGPLAGVNGGSGSTANYTYAITLAQGQAASLTVTFAANGSVTSATAGSNSNGSSDPNAQPSWLQTAVSALFVPDQAHIDEAKGSLAGIYSWGPFALIAQMVTLGNTAAAPASPISIPIPTVMTPAQDGGCGCHYDPNSQAAIPIDFSPMTSRNEWTTFRLIISGCTWLLFVAALIYKFIPKQMM